MKEDRKFLRQCAICKKYLQKSDLIRLTKDYKTDKINLNDNNNVQGRSLYICKNIECIEKFLKNKKKISLLKAKMPENIEDIIHTVLTR